MIFLVFMIMGAYILGSVPFGFLIAKSHGHDLRKIGSGNIGATNTGRILGKKWGIICMVLDSLKGLIPMLIMKTHVSSPPTVSELGVWLAVGCAAVIGHVFPVFLKFKGGKGVATSLGMVIGLYPYYTLAGVVALAVWIGFVLITKYVSLASIASAAVFPVALIIAISVFKSWEFSNLWPLLVVSVVMSLLVIVRHAENIKRLLEGSETKVLEKRKS